ncbi:MAG: hypothetical protein ABSH50_12105 [Bryobacteraceae bacterium]|jgi:hypothetical protein
MLDPVSRAIGGAPPEDELIGSDEQRAVAISKEWFAHHEGIPFEDVVAELGFTMNQIHGRAETP